MNRTEIWINPIWVIIDTIFVVVWVNLTIKLLELFGMMWYQ